MFAIARFVLCRLPPRPSACRSEQVVWNCAGTSEFPIRHKWRRLGLWSRIASVADRNPLADHHRLGIVHASLSEFASPSLFQTVRAGFRPALTRARPREIGLSFQLRGFAE